MNVKEQNQQDEDRYAKQVEKFKKIQEDIYNVSKWVNMKEDERGSLNPS